MKSLKTLTILATSILLLTSCGGGGGTTSSSSSSTSSSTSTSSSSSSTSTSTTEPVTGFTVKWVVEGKVVEIDTGLQAGDMPSYDGETPYKKGASDDEWHAFSGWEPEVVAVTEDATYTATFEPAASTKDLCTQHCKAASMALFGTEIADDQKWDFNKVIYFANYVSYYTTTPEQGAGYIDNVLANIMGYTTIEKMTLDESGYYRGKYYHKISGIYAYGLTASFDGANTLMQIQFKHTNYVY